jgi:hypothetical protein
MNEDQNQLKAGYVNIYDEEEAEKWSKFFGITKEQLTNAVLAAGKSSVAIKKYLEKVNSAKLEQEKRKGRELNRGK